MDTIRVKEKGKTKMVAHRGVSGIELENTMASFVAAGNRDYFGVETDVHVTKDGKFIIFHDDTTGRIAEEDISLEENDFSRARSLRLLERGTEGGYSDMQRPLSLQEYLRIMRRYDKVAVIELKNEMAHAAISEILKICKSEYDLNKIIFISFSYANLEYVRKQLPEQAIQYLTGDYSKELIERLKRDRIDIDFYYPFLNEDRVKELHRNGIKINCYTCDDPVDAEKLIGWGVDMITTNILQ